MSLTDRMLSFSPRDERSRNEDHGARLPAGVDPRLSHGDAPAPRAPGARVPTARVPGSTAPAAPAPSDGDPIRVTNTH